MKSIASFFTLSAILVACSVRLIAPYDGVTDQKVSDLQEAIVIKFNEWERTIPPVATDNPFYDKTKGTLDILIQRNEAIEKSETLVAMLKKVKENIEIIEGLHRANQLSADVVKQTKPDIMAQLNAIQKFQMALKRAEEKK